MNEYIYTIYAHGNPREYAEKNKRNRTWSPYQYVPYHLKKDEVLDVFVTGKTDEKFFAVIGLPSDSENTSTYPLSSGSNFIDIKKSGLLSFVNKSDSEDVNIEIKSSHQRVPYFKLYKNTCLEFEKEMELYSNSQYVILSNKKSDIIVTYSSAKKYIKDAQKLMENYDLLIETENRVTGVFSNGKADYKLDPNRNLHIEVDHGYMFATNEYTGYNEAQGAMTQLLGLSNDRWGVWHENGHQRQQFPWEWSAGTGLTEVTTNIYSLSVQEVLFGKASRLDDVTPQIKIFLDDDNPGKSYDNLDLFVKLGLFWQLKLAFGDQFYPQLHQIYRLMRNNPPPSDNHAQKQLFIRTVSNLVKINLSPFFSKWGIEPDLNTISEVSFLPKLKSNIWENTNENYYKLDMPEPKYIPELAYFKNSISNVIINYDSVKFIIDKDWYSPYNYTFNRNGVYVGSISDGVDYYCYSKLTDNGYEITRTFSGDELSESDIFSIDIDYQGKHVVYYSSMEINKLWADIENIFSDQNLTELKNEIDQGYLDELWERYISVSNEYTIEIRNKIIFSQYLLISKTIKRDDFDQSNYIIEFNDLSFNDYQYKIVSNDNVIADLINGKPSKSTMNGLVWNIPVNVNECSGFHILVNVHGHDLVVKVGFVEGSLLDERVDELYSDKENEILKNSVSQSNLDSLRNSILNSNLPFWKKRLLLNNLDNAQRIFLNNTISNTYISDKHLRVTFSDNTIFRDYRYM